MKPNKERVEVLLIFINEQDQLNFVEAFKTIKINTSINVIKNEGGLINYMKAPSTEQPHIIFIDINTTSKSALDFLIELRKFNDMRNLTIVIYSNRFSEKEMEEFFLYGANVFLKKPLQHVTLRKKLHQILTVNWQYQTSNLNRDNFILLL